jgi:DNA ligase (NAD+)
VNDKKTLQTRISQLAAELISHRGHYYQGSPLISDEEYDRLEDELRALAPQHPLLQVVGSELPASSTPKIAHGIPMLSLAKTYSRDELLSWSRGQPLVGTLKIDGVSLSLLYREGKLITAKTRGNGLWGEEVTAKAQWISDCVPTLAGRAGANAREQKIFAACEVRGELYCSQAQFAELLQAMVALGLPAATSPRNIVAGILGRKQHQQLAAYFSFYAFDLLAPVDGPALPFTREEEKFAFLARCGFHLPLWERLQTAGEVEKFLQVVQEKIAEGDLGIDGAVFILNDLEVQTQQGATSHHPRYKMAFKWQGDTAETTIKALHWNTSRYGVVTPVAVVEPVVLSGATISNVSLHNAAYVKNFALCPGDRIKIVRSGEVIPKFLEKLAAGSATVQVPRSCPSCGAALIFDQVRLLCGNELSCPAQQMGRILNWIVAAGIDDLSEKRLAELMAAGLVQRSADLYRLSREELLSLPLTKDKMATKLLANIAKSTQLSLAAFLQGLGIKGVGRRGWEDLLAHYPQLAEIQALTREQICQIHGFAAKTAEQIVQGLAAQRETIAELLAAGVRPQEIAAKKQDLPWSGKTFAITGTFSLGRKELSEKISALGGKVSSQVSQHTYALIIADAASTSEKAKTARNLGVALWNEDQLMDQLKALQEKR